MFDAQKLLDQFLGTGSAGPDQTPAAASLLAIDPDGPAERGYLAMLAARLGLEPALVAHLHASVAEATA